MSNISKSPFEDAMRFKRKREAKKRVFDIFDRMLSSLYKDISETEAQYYTEIWCSNDLYNALGVKETQNKHEVFYRGLHVYTSRLIAPNTAFITEGSAFMEAYK